MSTFQMSEADRKNLNSNQLLGLAKQHGVVLSPVEQTKLNSDQLIRLAELGQTLTDDAKKKGSTQKCVPELK